MESNWYLDYAQLCKVCNVYGNAEGICFPSLGEDLPVVFSVERFGGFRGLGVRRALSNFWGRPSWKPRLKQEWLKIQAKTEHMGPLLYMHLAIVVKTTPPHVLYTSNIQFMNLWPVPRKLNPFMAFWKKGRQFTFQCFYCEVISTSFQTSLSSSILLKSLEDVWILW